MVVSKLTCSNCKNKFEADLEQDAVVCPECKQEYQQEVKETDEVSAPKHIGNGR
jgi:hypothetical protein